MVGLEVSSPISPTVRVRDYCEEEQRYNAGTEDHYFALWVRGSRRVETGAGVNKERSLFINASEIDCDRDP